MKTLVAGFDDNENENENENQKELINRLNRLYSGLFDIPKLPPIPKPEPPRYWKIGRLLDGIGGSFGGMHIGILDISHSKVYDAVNRGGRLTFRKMSLSDWRQGKQERTFKTCHPRSSNSTIRERLQSINSRLKVDYVRYNTATHNCEHVAEWVLTGYWISPQAEETGITLFGSSS